MTRHQANCSQQLSSIGTAASGNRAHWTRLLCEVVTSSEQEAPWAEEEGFTWKPVLTWQSRLPREDHGAVTSHFTGRAFGKQNKGPALWCSGQSHSLQH